MTSLNTEHELDHFEDRNKNEEELYYQPGDTVYRLRCLVRKNGSEEYPDQRSTECYCFGIRVSAANKGDAEAGGDNPKDSCRCSEKAKKDGQSREKKLIPDNVSVTGMMEKIGFGCQGTSPAEISL